MALTIRRFAPGPTAAETLHEAEASNKRKDRSLIIVVRLTSQIRNEWEGKERDWLEKRALLGHFIYG